MSKRKQPSKKRFASVVDHFRRDFKAVLEYIRTISYLSVALAHFCGNWIFYVLLSWLPIYLTEHVTSYYNLNSQLQQGVGIELSGMLSTVGFALATACLISCGFISDRMSKRFSIQFVRKFFNALGSSKLFAHFAESIGFMIPALCMTIIVLWPNIYVSAAGLLIATGASGFLDGGFVPCYSDIGGIHAGALLSVANAFAQVPFSLAMPD